MKFRVDYATAVVFLVLSMITFSFAPNPPGDLPRWFVMTLALALLLGAVSFLYQTCLVDDLKYAQHITAEVQKISRGALDRSHNTMMKLHEETRETGGKLRALQEEAEAIKTEVERYRHLLAWAAEEERKKEMEYEMLVARDEAKITPETEAQIDRVQGALKVLGVILTPPAETQIAATARGIFGCTDETVWKWMDKPHQDMGGKTPRETIRAGNAALVERILAAARCQFG